MQFFVSISLLSCTPTVDDARKVEVGISSDSLKALLGDPFSVEIEPGGSEEWFFTYYSGGHTQGMCVTIINNKVSDFYSY